MKKALALFTFTLAMALPLVSFASSITSTFAGSSTGNSSINVGDTISFDIAITLDPGTNYPAFGFTFVGDVANASADNPLTHDQTLNQVTGFVLNETFPGTGFVNWGTSTSTFPGVGTGVSLSGHFGRATAFDGNNGSGLGTTVTIGTVTILADTAGSFLGGAFIAGVDSLGPDGPSTVVNAAAFTVVPEPGTALLMFLGLGGLGVMGRKSRN